MGCIASKPRASRYVVDEKDGLSPGSSGHAGSDDSSARGGTPRFLWNAMRGKGMTEKMRRDGAKKKKDKSAKAGKRASSPEDVNFIKDALGDSVVFHELDDDTKDAVARAMTELRVRAGARLIEEGEIGRELFLVADGTFVVTIDKQGSTVTMNEKKRGDVFGEISLMFETPRTATVSATTDARVWTLERDVFRDLTRTAAMASDAGNLVFLNSVPLLASLTVGERVRLAEALEEKTFKPGETVVTQGEVGDMFYIVRKGEAVVTKRSMSTGHLSFGDGSVHGGRRSREGSVHGGRRSREGSVYGGRRSREGSDHGASQLAQMLANGGGEDATSAATENDANASSPSPPPSPGPVASPSGHERVNHLFRGDFFGEKALLTRKPREATVTAVGSSALVCLCLNAPAFEDLLGPLEQLMERAKSPEIVAQRMNAIENEGRWARARFIIKSDKSKSDGGPGGGGGGGGGGDGDASGDENGEGSVAIGACAAETFAGTFSNDSSMAEITLHERELLGGGASGYVRLVVADVCGNGTMKSFALKRMRKCAVVSTPDHVYCEQSVSQELNHFACVRQHASFQDADHLYFLFDHLDGCDMMDALAAVATVQPFKNPDKPTGSKIKMLKGMPEEMAMYYVAVVTLALEYLHEKQIVYRDLKPENVFLANDGTAVLGDFGFSKKLEKDALTYTFCGTPGYVAPEVILAHGYSTSVDWWGLGVMTYVLLTGQQPFSQIVKGKPEDPLTVMKRIVDRSWAVSFPVYISESAVDLMSWFLERRRARRLGNLRRKAEDVKTHAWFKDAKFDWDAMQRGQLKPRPLALSEAFATQRANRIADLEREIATASFAETEEEIEDAKETFRAF